MENSKPITIPELRAMRARGEKIASLTCYDASYAVIEDRAGVDLVLIGDSLGNVIQGEQSTTPVTVEHIAYHTRCVAPHLKRAFVVADLPFLSYATREIAIRSCGKLMQEGGAKMVKLEGGREEAETIEFLSVRGVPVCAHIGLQPQKVHKLGGFKTQGASEAEAEIILEDAKILEQAGADVLLVEKIPAELGRRLAAQSGIPVIGIGAGPDVDGQILVVYDMLNISAIAYTGRRPRFVRNFMEGAPDVESAVRAYVQAVKSGVYPAPEHCF